MKSTHLKTLSARIDEINTFLERITKWTAYDLVVSYNNFLKQPLTLSQFVPCDENGVPLKEPKEPRYSAHPELAADENAIYSDSLVDYYDDLREAQKNVIFEGWEALNHMVIQNKVTKDKFMFILAHGELRIWFDKFEHKDAYLTLYIGKNPTLADLAAATISNPIKFR